MTEPQIAHRPERTVAPARPGPARQVRMSLVGHSSIQVFWPGVNLICDPWFSGAVFNNSLQLSPAPDVSKIDLSTITHIWISHEHPDHFHLPSLRMIAESVDPTQITVMHQESNSDKVFDALRGIGFTRFVAMRHMEKITIADGLELFIYAHKQLDSMLGVIAEGQNVLLNINDTELSDNDRRRVFDRFGAFPVVFDQFSIAGYDGHPRLDSLAEMASHLLDMMVADHRAVRAQVTIPFASFVYFNRPDNADLNAFHNDALDARNHLEANGCHCTLLRPNSPAMTVDELIAWDDAPWYEEFYARRELAIDPLESIDLASCQDAFAERTSIWKNHTWRLLYSKLDPISAWIDDLGSAVTMDFAACALEPIDAAKDDCELIINSQPLWFAFKNSFGIQTLGVSGRYRFNTYPRTWRWIRIMSSLSNANIHLRTRTLMSPTTARWLMQRTTGLPGQIRQQFIRFSAEGTTPV